MTNTLIKLFLLIHPKGHQCSLVPRLVKQIIIFPYDLEIYRLTLYSFQRYIAFKIEEYSEICVLSYRAFYKLCLIYEWFDWFHHNSFEFLYHCSCQHSYHWYGKDWKTLPSTWIGKRIQETVFWIICARRIWHLIAGRIFQSFPK